VRRSNLDVLVLDAYNVLFRSFSSLPRAITGRNDEPVNAVYGALAFVLRMLREYQPDRIVAAFDVPDVPTFRHQLFPGYQAQRGPLGGEHAEDFARQVAMAQDILPRVGIPALYQAGFEADDVMGSVARSVASSGGRARLVSTDRDLLQLVGPGIELLVPGKEMLNVASPDAVRRRIGVDPEYVTTFKALAGDASDNIPGLPGIGAKTAIRLIDDFGDLDRILASAGEVPARTARILTEGAADARLFEQVATIETGLEIGGQAFSLPALALSIDDRPRAILDRFGYGRENGVAPG
jgi:DNA polymerase-1